MRTDVKVGLICVFALVLTVVAYFALQSNSTDKQKAADTTVVVTTPAPAGVALSPSPTPATSTAPMTAPETPIAGGSSLLGPRSAYAQADNGGGSFTGPVIAPPGSSTTAPAPYPTSPSLLTAPTTGPADSPLTYPTPSTPLLPPVTPTTPTYTPTTPTTPTHGSISIPSTPTHRPTGPTIEVPLPSTPDSFSPSTPGTASIYVIQKGDTLSPIAKKNGVSLKALLAANPTVNPNKMKIGTKINIPAATASTPSMPKPTPSATTKPGKKPSTTTKPAGKITITPGSSYTIKKGDSLRKIAKAAYGDENMWRRIFRANRGDMESGEDIVPGQVIKIPK